MKKTLIISLFVLGLIIPNIDVKAVDVSNEEELRAAIEQGGDVILTEDIVVTQPIVIDKDVNIYGAYGSSIFMQGDNTLLTVNSGNVSLGIVLYAGWNGEYNNKYGYPEGNVVKNQGTGLEVNGGTVNLANLGLHAGNVGLEVNGGTVTISEYSITSIYAGEHNENNNTYSGGKGIIVNSGKVELLDGLKLFSGGTALTVSDDSAVILTESTCGLNRLYSYESNGIEVNDGAEINIYGGNEIFGSKNAIYLNGGTANLNGKIFLGSSTGGRGIYINKGINTKTNEDVLKLNKNFIFSYKTTPSESETTPTPNFSIYVNHDITELRVTDEKGFMKLLEDKISVEFCGGYFSLCSQTEEEKKAICENLNANLDGPIESNELGKCTAVYINGVKQKDASCNPVADNKNEPSQIVNVPATSAYVSIIIIVLGILCVIVSVIVTRKVTKKS